MKVFAFKRKNILNRKCAVSLKERVLKSIVLLLHQKSYLLQVNNLASVPVGFQPVNIASLVNKSGLEILLVFKHQDFSASSLLLFNWHRATFALIICFKKLFIQVCAIPEVVPNPQPPKPPIYQPSQIAEHVTLQDLR